VRLERLADRLDLGHDGGCPVCRPDEQRVPFAFEKIPPEAPLSNTCAACGRCYALNYFAFSWLRLGFQGSVAATQQKY
jgi:hypothetical protein